MKTTQPTNQAFENILRQMHSKKLCASDQVTHKTHYPVKILTSDEDRIIRDIERLNLMITILEQTESLDRGTFLLHSGMLNNAVKELRSCLK